MIILIFFSPNFSIFCYHQNIISKRKEDFWRLLFSTSLSNFPSHSLLHYHFSYWSFFFNDIVPIFVWCFFIFFYRHSFLSFQQVLLKLLTFSSKVFVKNCFIGHFHLFTWFYHRLHFFFSFSFFSFCEVSLFSSPPLHEFPLIPLSHSSFQLFPSSPICISSYTQHSFSFFTVFLLALFSLYSPHVFRSHTCFFYILVCHSPFLFTVFTFSSHRSYFLTQTCCLSPFCFKQKHVSFQQKSSQSLIISFLMFCLFFFRYHSFRAGIRFESFSKIVVLFRLIFLLFFFFLFMVLFLYTHKID